MGARKLERYLTRQFEVHVSRASIEREQKYRVAGVDTIRRRLLKLGARVHASGFERNELYDCNDRLGGQGLKLRLRCHGGKIARLTVKGPRQNGRQKTRMEIETPVEYEAAVARFALITSLTLGGLSKSKARKRKLVGLRAASDCGRATANTGLIEN